MRVLIYNPNEKGHSLVFLKRLIPALVALGCRVKIALTAGGFSSPEYQLHLRTLGSPFDVDDSVLPPPEPYDRAWGLREFRRALERARPDHVMVPFADPILPALGAYSLLGRRLVPPGVSADYTQIRADFAYPAAGLKKKAWLWAKERSLAAMPEGSISIIDPVAYQNIQRRRSSLFQKVVSVLRTPSTAKRREMNNG